MGSLERAVYTLGLWIRETGQAVDRLGSRLQGSYYFQEQPKRLPSAQPAQTPAGMVLVDRPAEGSRTSTCCS